MSYVAAVNAAEEHKKKKEKTCSAKKFKMSCIVCSSKP